MSFVGDGGFAQGIASNRPPLFCDDNFTHWKSLMKMFIMDQDLELWSIIQKGPHTFYTEVGRRKIPKFEVDLSAAELEKHSKNYKAIHLLYCALNAEEFNRISSCKIAKEIWDKLVVTFEGTNQVKQTKINLLLRQYELFKMNPEESIKGMFKRFIA